MRMRTKYNAWAIQWRYPNEEREFLVGRYWFMSHPPPSFHGHMICVFKTRREARAGLRGQRSPDGRVYGRARVVRVEVEVTTR